MPRSLLVNAFRYRKSLKRKCDEDSNHQTLCISNVIEHDHKKCHPIIAKDTSPSSVLSSPSSSLPPTPSEDLLNQNWRTSEGVNLIRTSLHYPSEGITGGQSNMHPLENSNNSSLLVLNSEQRSKDEALYKAMIHCTSQLGTSSDVEKFLNFWNSENVKVSCNPLFLPVPLWFNANDENMFCEHWRTQQSFMFNILSPSFAATSSNLSKSFSMFEIPPYTSTLQQLNDPHVCTDCGKRYSTSSNLARHKQCHKQLLGNMSSSDNAIKQSKKCPHCDKTYVSVPAYNMHVRTHNQGCVCPHCGKRFSRPWLLQGHLRTHTGEKPFRCSQCSKTFADKSNLRAHIQTHSTEKPFVCGRCNKAFALKSYLYKHEESSCMRNSKFFV